MGIKGSFNPTKDIPDLSSRTILITGGTAGLGKQTIQTLAAHHAHTIYFTGRNKKAADNLISETKATRSPTKLVFLPCDQTSLDSIKKAAESFLSQCSVLDVLVCNAGVMGTPPALTKDGYEEQFGINYLSHALLTKLLLPALRQSASATEDARVIFLTSLGHKMPPSGGIVFDSLKTPQEDLGPLSKWMRYGQSKLAMVLFVEELEKQEPSLTATAIHPGICFTGLVTTLPKADYYFVKLTTLGRTISAEQASWNTLWAVSTNKSRLKARNPGEIFVPVGTIEPPSRLAKDVRLAGRLWDWTEKELAPFCGGS